MRPNDLMTSPSSDVGVVNTMTRTAPTMIISPATIQVEKSIASVPKTASQRFQGSMSDTTIAPPHAVYAMRSDTPATCSSGIEAEQNERDAEHDRRRRARARPGHDQQDAEQDRHRREHEPPPPPTGRRLGKVPDRRRDVHHAHAPRRDGDHDEGQQHPEREGDDEAARESRRTRSGAPRPRPPRRRRSPSR